MNIVWSIKPKITIAKHMDYKIAATTMFVAYRLKNIWMCNQLVISFIKGLRVP